MEKEIILNYVIESYKDVTALLEQVRDGKITPEKALKRTNRYLKDEVFSALDEAGYFEEGE